jgi:hypothetical protein
MAAAAASVEPEEHFGEERERTRGLAPVLRSRGSHAKGSRRKEPASSESGEKRGSGDQRETQPAAWMLLLLEARSWWRPRGEEEEMERERREEVGGAGAGSEPLEWRLWGGRYAMADSPAAGGDEVFGS